MFFSGISDEAGQAIDTQIKAHQELGWTHLELRLVDGQNITALSDEKFDEVYRKVSEAGMSVSCFGSAIANWARPITCDASIDIEDLKRAIPRMKRFGTCFIRVMSYPNDPKSPIAEPEWRKEAIARTKVLAKMAEDGGIILAHENCSGWGGLSAENSNILLGEVNSPALKVVFDTGNPVTYGQNAWEYYQKVYDSIVYVHIKDARKVDGVDVYTYCGEGDGYVKEIVGDLLAKGYDGGFSIEPHLAAVIHTGQKSDSDAKLYESYTEYGRRLMKIVEEVKR
ncbi:MAG: sugar phosphate isomerase/epimerase [Candidatus Hydrogenedentes bacterium]|nr:sugar phosphate isomerase/epimerase [Candidatus Hydrogenedentota bacterium]